MSRASVLTTKTYRIGVPRLDVVKQVLHARHLGIPSAARDLRICELVCVS